MVFQCKMCGGQLAPDLKSKLATCEICGTCQTVPSLDDDKRANLIDMANHFRRNAEYDKANGMLLSLLSEDTKDADAYWSLVLCKYGIQYELDDVTGTMLPTLNRMQRASIFADEDYKRAIRLAAPNARDLYQAEAKRIDEIQQRYSAIMRDEKPYDVFICYKDKDATGRQTLDSFRANAIYKALTAAGLRVFFASVTLKNKLGKDWEAIIYSALSTAKVMLVVVTSRENAYAPWVRNEWSRFINMIKNGEEKTLIPVFEQMDAYDLPDEFSNMRLQAKDMSDLSYIKDIVENVKSITGVNKPISTSEVARPTTTAEEQRVESANVLIKRAYIYLSGADFNSAHDYFQRALDLVPENPRGYVGLMLAENGVAAKDESGLAQLKIPLHESKHFVSVLEFSQGEYRDWILELEQDRLKYMYDRQKDSLDELKKLSKPLNQDNYMIDAIQFEKLFTEYTNMRDKTLNEYRRISKYNKTIARVNEINTFDKSVLDSVNAIRLNSKKIETRRGNIRNTIIIISSIMYLIMAIKFITIFNAHDITISALIILGAASILYTIATTIALYIQEGNVTKDDRMFVTVAGAFPLCSIISMIVAGEKFWEILLVGVPAVIASFVMFGVCYVIMYVVLGILRLMTKNK